MLIRQYQYHRCMFQPKKYIRLVSRWTLHYQWWKIITWRGNTLTIWKNTRKEDCYGESRSLLNSCVSEYIRFLTFFYVILLNETVSLIYMWFFLQKQIRRIVKTKITYDVNCWIGKQRWNIDKVVLLNWLTFRKFLFIYHVISGERIIATSQYYNKNIRYNITPYN